MGDDAKIHAYVDDMNGRIIFRLKVGSRVVEDVYIYESQLERTSDVHDDLRRIATRLSKRSGLRYDVVAHIDASIATPILPERGRAKQGQIPQGVSAEPCLHEDEDDEPSWWDILGKLLLRAKGKIPTARVVKIGDDDVKG